MHLVGDRSTSVSFGILALREGDVPLGVRVIDRGLRCWTGPRKAALPQGRARAAYAGVGDCVKRALRGRSMLAFRRGSSTSV
jgi:hypothetical protein